MSLYGLTRKMSKYYETNEKDIDYNPNKAKIPTFNTPTPIPYAGSQSNNPPSVSKQTGSGANAVGMASANLGAGVAKKQTIPVSQRQFGIGMRQTQAQPQRLPYAGKVSASLPQYNAVTPSGGSKVPALPYYQAQGISSDTWKKQAEQLKEDVAQQQKTVRPWQNTSGTMQTASYMKTPQAFQKDGRAMSIEKPESVVRNEQKLADLKSSLANAQNLGYMTDYSEQWRAIESRDDAEDVKAKLARMASMKNNIGTDMGQNIASMNEYQLLRGELESKGINAEGVADWLRRNSNVMDAYYQQQRDAARAEEHPIIESLKTVPQSLYGGTGALAGVTQSAMNSRTGEYRPIDTMGDAFDIARSRQTVRGTVGEKAAQAVYEATGNQNLANAAKFLYGTAMSGLDSAFIAALGGGATAAIGATGGTAAINGAASIILGSNAASETMMDVVNRGGSTNQAVAAGILSGAAETIFEKVSIDGLISKFKSGEKGFRAFIKNATLQGASEASEEMATEIANVIADYYVNGGLSEIEQMRQSGMSDVEIANEIAKRVGVAGAGGFLMGFVGGGAASAFNRTSLSLREQRALNALSEKTGVAIQIDDDIEGSNGYFDRNTNTLHISRNSNNAVYQVAAHEITHSIESNPAEWRQLYEIANANLSEDARSKLEYVLQKTGYTDADMQSEVVSHYVQQCVTDIKSFEQLVGVNRNLAQRIVDAFESFVRKLTGQRNIGNDSDTQYLREFMGDITPEQAQQTLAQMKKALGAKTEGGNFVEDGQQLSRKLSNGKYFAWVESSPLSNKQLDDHRAVADYISEHIGEMYTIIESGQKVYIGEDLPGEYTQSRYTSYLKNKNRKLLRAKNKAVDGFGDMIEIATNRRWEQTEHPESKDAKYGMYRYDSSFAFPVKDNNGNVQNVRAFDVELVIRNASDGKKYLYDIVNIKENTAAAFDLEKQARQGGNKSATQGGVSNSNNTQNSNSVNTQKSLKLSPEAIKQNIDAAVSHFGTTNRINEAGYLTIDGKMLDFSGKHDGAPGGYRTVDHRDIREALGLDYGGDSYSGGMIQFMSEGNIRLVPESGGFNLSVKPTEAQETRLKRYIQNFGGEVIVDFDNANGDTVGSVEYPARTPASLILQEIRDYFDKGKMPENFDYSRKLNREALREMAERTRAGIPYAPGYVPKQQLPIVGQPQQLPYAPGYNAAENAQNRAVQAENAPLSLARQYAGQNISNSQATEILDDPESVKEMTDAGVDLSGTSSQRRKAIKDYVSSIGSHMADTAQSESDIDRELEEAREELKYAKFMYDYAEGDSFFTAAERLREVEQRVAELEQIKTYEESVNPISQTAGEVNTQTDAAGYVPKQQLPRAEQSNPQPIPYNPAAQAAETPAQPTLPMAEELNSELQKNAQEPNLPSYGDNTVGSAQVNPESYAHLQNEYGVVAPGENPARVIDMPVKDAQGQTNSLFARTVAESESMPNEMVPEWEQAVASGEFSHDISTDEAATRHAERELNKGWDYAMRQWQAVSEGDKIATKNDLALGQLLLANAMKDGDTQTAMKLAAELCAEATRAGRAVQSFRLLKKMTPEGMLYYLQKTVNNLNSDFEGRKGFEGIKIDEGMAERLGKATTREEMNAIVDEIKQDIAAQTPVTWYDKWNAWRYLSMLGNPTTQVRNVMGNALFVPVVKAKNLIATGIEAAWKKTGHLPYATKAVLTAKDKGLVDFADNDFANVLQEIQGGGKYSDKDDVLSKRKIFKNRFLEGWRNLTNTVMDKGDEIFSRQHYRSSLAQYMKANGLTPDTITPEQLNRARNYAIQEAQRATYRDASSVASLINRAKRTLAQTANNKENDLSKRAAARAGEVLLEGFVPFTKTPVNIVKRGIEYSPIGLAQGTINLVRSVKNGDVDAASAIDRMASGLTGSGLLALGAWLASLGLVSGGPGEDDREEKYKGMLGGQDYALNLGDKTYTIDWMAPEALPFFTGVELYKEMQSKDGITLADTIGLISAMSDPIVELSMLSSVNSTFESIKYSQGDALSTVAGNLITSYLGQGVPTIGGKAARTIDETSRQTYYDPNKTGAVKSADVFRQKVQAKIPFAANALPERVDLWGRTEKNAGGNIVGRFFYNMLSPGYLENKNVTKVDNELLRLAEATGDSNVYPDTADKTFKVNGESVKLDSKQYTHFSKTKGQTAFEILDAAVDSGTYKKMTDAEKADFVKDVYEYANAKAKAEISDYQLDGKNAKIAQAEQKGIKPAQYLTITGGYDKDGNGSVTQEEVKTVLDKTNLTTAQKAYMWKLQNKGWKNNPYE